MDCFVARGRAEESFSFQWANPHICAIVVTSFISLVATFFLSFYRKSPRAHYAAPPLPKKLTLFEDPNICFCCKDRDSNRAIRRIETVRWTVSAKFINEFGATCLLCFAQFTLITLLLLSPKSLRFSWSPNFTSFISLVATFLFQKSHQLAHLMEYNFYFFLICYIIGKR